MTLLLNKFCCCCTTRTGALVIGTLGWILTLLQIFAGVDEHHQNQNEHSYGNRENGFESFRQNIYFQVGFGLLALLVCILLVVGVYKKDRRYILPWLVLRGLEGTGLVIFTGILFCVACVHGSGTLFAFTFALLLTTVLQWYFWLCVFSHYKELGEPAPNGVVYSSGNTAPPLYVEKEYNMA